MTQHDTLTPEQLDQHLDAILKAAGSALRHYTMQKSRDDMRAALRAALSATQPAQAAQSEPVRELKSALSGMLTFFGMDEDADSKPVFDKARKALDVECAPYTTIDMGYGKWEVGAGTNAEIPCIAFGKNGSGRVGELITLEPRQMSAEETHAVITFANAEGLAVLQEKMDEVRSNFFPAAQAAQSDGRGTDAQIEKERDIARHAIVGSLAAGYAGQVHPGADHWLAAAHEAGARIKELEDQAAQGAGEVVGEVGIMPGTTSFTMACFRADEVPVGAKLYTHPTPAQPAPVVPDGWRLVPVEPTEGMSLAGRFAWQGHHMAVYRAMLAATPTPPAQAQQSDRVTPEMFQQLQEQLQEQVKTLKEIGERKIDGCECSAEDACRFAMERDEARALVAELKAQQAAGVPEASALVEALHKIKAVSLADAQVIALEALAAATEAAQVTDALKSARMATSQDDGRFRVVLQFTEFDDANAVHSWLMSQGVLHYNGPGSHATQAQAAADARDAGRYRMVRRGQHWSVINGIGDTLRGDDLDAAIDAQM